MKDNTCILIVALVISGAMGISAMVMGQVVIAATCAGGIVGMLGGHLNGTHTDTAPLVITSQNEEKDPCKKDE